MSHEKSLGRKGAPLIKALANDRSWPSAAARQRRANDGRAATPWIAPIQINSRRD